MTPILAFASTAHGRAGGSFDRDLTTMDNSTPHKTPATVNTSTLGHDAAMEGSLVVTVLVPPPEPT